MAENNTQEEQNGNGYKEDRNIGLAVFMILSKIIVKIITLVF